MQSITRRLAASDRMPRVLCAQRAKSSGLHALSVTLLAVCSQVAIAQQSPPAEPAPAAPPATQETQVRSELEPAVDTSASPAPQEPQSPAAQPASPPAGNAQQGPRTGNTRGKAMDRIELDVTQITGNRELPKVLYIVPWKRSDLGDLVGKPVNSLLDEVLAPVDRDVFRRQTRYYQALRPGENVSAETGGNSARDAQPGTGQADGPGARNEK